MATSTDERNVGTLALARALPFAGTLAVRLTQGAAVDLSDAELVRCFRDCTAPGRCVSLAQVLRAADVFERVGSEWCAVDPHGERRDD